MSDRLFPSRPLEPIIDPDLLEMAESLLARVRSGLVLGLALVEHHRGDEVAISVSATPSYHYLNSGSARLANFLAGQKGD